MQSEFTTQLLLVVSPIKFRIKKKSHMPFTIYIQCFQILYLEKRNPFHFNCNFEIFPHYKNLSSLLLKHTGVILLQ